jgi:tRNA pseudouridine38-40 synthase
VIEPDPIRVRLDVAYDGAGFSGWATQPGRRTVQQTLQEALSWALRPPRPLADLAGCPPRPAAAAEPWTAALTVAGRTDAGVHARGQVAHCDVPAGNWSAAGDIARRRLARALPPDVRVRGVAAAPPGFDARFSALWRRYSYRICDDPANADPLGRHDTLWYPRTLDLDAMNEAARACLGEHDFAAFCRRREGASTVRALLRLEWVRTGPSLVTATVVADAFCHNMVRALVGAALRVGSGSRPPRWPAELLAARVRDPGVPVVGAHGLCLEEVGYPPDGQMSARAAATRRQRTLPGSSADPASASAGSAPSRDAPAISER